MLKILKIALKNAVHSTRIPNVWESINGHQQPLHSKDRTFLVISVLFPYDKHHELKSNPLYAFKAKSADPDTMYLHEAMKQPDRKEFLKAIKKEVTK